MSIDIQQLLIFQIIADVILCIAIIFLLRAIIKDIKKKTHGVDEKTLLEFRKMLDESQGSAENLLQALDEGKASLRGIAGSLNEKEKKLEMLIEQSEIQLKKLNVKSLEPADSSPGNKYEDVIRMIEKGLTEKEISKSLGLTEGEINLIIDLDRRKNFPQNTKLPT